MPAGVGGGWLGGKAAIGGGRSRGKRTVGRGKDKVAKGMLSYSKICVFDLKKMCVESIQNILLSKKILFCNGNRGCLE